MLENGNALSAEGTLEVAVISPFLRQGLRWCGLCRDPRSLNHVLPGAISTWRSIRNNTAYNEKGRQHLSGPQMYRSDFSTAPLLDLAISFSACLSLQVCCNSDGRINPLRAMNTMFDVLSISQIKVY